MTYHQYNGNFNGPRKNVSEPNLMGFDRSLKRFYDISMLSEENERKKSKMAQKIVNGPEKMSSILAVQRFDFPVDERKESKIEIRDVMLTGNV